MWKTNFDIEDWQSALGEETSGLNETVAELDSPVKGKVDVRSALKELQQPNVQVSVATYVIIIYTEEGLWLICVIVDLLPGTLLNFSGNHCQPALRQKQLRLRK